MKIISFFIFLNIYRSPNKILSYSSAKKWLKGNDIKNIIYGNDTSISSLNCEHIVPQSFLKKYNIDKKSRSDLHILYLTNSRLNSHRQNYKFNNLYYNYILLDEKGNKNTTNTHCKKDTKKREFEPPEKSKGKIARSVGYFYWNYSPVFEDKLLNRKLLVDWNRQYKVTKEEKERNEEIFKVQKNKNIFIQYPILVPILFSSPIFFLIKTINYSRYKNIK